MDPVMLPANQPADRFYRGGAAISAFRGAAAAGDRVPEDWVASTTTVAGHAHLGLSHLPDGTLLRDAMVHDPVAWLGREHVSCYGVDSKLLVKLLDAGERLPVHAHPAAEFAHRHLGRAHGKAEAWFVLAGGEVYLGLTRDVTVGELRALVDDQDVERLLSMLHRREVAAGDTVYVPPGTLHAIGAATFLVEVQEPEDLSILLEWRDFAIDGRLEGHLGLGFDTALGAVDIRGRSADEISRLIMSAPIGQALLPPDSEQYFRASRHSPGSGSAASVDLEAGFCVLVVTEGVVHIGSESGWSAALVHGSTVVVPHAAGRLSVSGSGELIVLRPPTPVGPTR